MLELKSRSKKDTQKIAKLFVKELVRIKRQRATVLALEGNLGAGKTTFAQGIARALGIKEQVFSPTFVLVKMYLLPLTTKKKIGFKHVIHIDCYRLNSAKDISALGLKNFFNDQNALIMIEWADKIKKILPADTAWLQFNHGKKISERYIQIRTP